MASIQRIASSLTGRISFRVQVRLRGHRSVSATFHKRRGAERWAAAIESAILERRHFPHSRAQRVTFDVLIQRYRETVLPEVSSPGRAAAERHLAWWRKSLGTLTLAEITPERVAEARDTLANEPYMRAKPRSPTKGSGTPPRTYQRSGATVNRYLATLSHIFAAAVREWHLVDTNPVRDVSKKKESRGRIRFLRDEEREALLRACRRSNWPALHALVLLAISTGARRGELIRLQWSEVTLDGHAPQAIIQHTKNGDPRRLPLVGKALEALRALQRMNNTRSRFVFPSDRCADEPYRNFDAHWHAALSRAGIADFRFHDLRHTCASYLAGQGASLLEIADVLGHRTMAMVRRYSHLAQDHKTGVIERMTKARGL